MTRLGHVVLSGAVVVAALLVVLTTDTNREGAGAASWEVSYALQDPDPGFWRSDYYESSELPRAYAAGMSSLVAMSRVRIAPGSDLELTNLSASGVLVLESGALVLTDAEGHVALRRGGASPGTEPAPIGVGSLLIRGDRIAYRTSATVAFRNPKATSASLLMLTELPPLPSSGVLH